MTGDLERQLDVFGTGALRMILGYRWPDHVSNEKVAQGESDETYYLHDTRVPDATV